MTIKEILENLCDYDELSPSFDAEYAKTPRENCFCDNCYYGRDKLAVELLKLKDKS